MRQPSPIYVPNRRIPNAEYWNSAFICRPRWIDVYWVRRFIVYDSTNDVLEYDSVFVLQIDTSLIYDLLDEYDI